MTFIKGRVRSPTVQEGSALIIKAPSLTVGLLTLRPTKKGTARRALHQTREFHYGRLRRGGAVFSGTTLSVFFISARIAFASLLNLCVSGALSTKCWK